MDDLKLDGVEMAESRDVEHADLAQLHGREMVSMLERAISADDIAESTATAVNIFRTYDLETAKRIICEAAMRVLGHKKGFGSMLRRVIGTNPALAVLTEIDQRLRNGGENSLVAYYKQHYKGGYAAFLAMADENARIADQNVQACEDPASLTFPKVRELKPHADSRTMRVLFDFLLEAHKKPLLRVPAGREIENFFQGITSASQLFVLSVFRAEMKRTGDTIGNVDTIFTQSTREFLSKAENVWEVIRLWWVGSALAREPDADLAKLIHAATPPHLNYLAQRIIEERDLLQPLMSAEIVAVPAVPDLLWKACSRELLSRPDLLTNESLLGAIIMSGARDASFVGELESYVARQMVTADDGGTSILERFKMILARLKYTPEAVAEAAVSVGKLSEDLTRRRDDAQVRGEPIGRNGRQPRTREKPLLGPDAAKETNELKDTQAAEVIRDALAKVKIPPDIEKRVLALNAVKSDLEAEIVEALSNETACGEAWGEKNEIVVSIEENSVLKMMGVKAVRFRKSNSYDVEFIFEGNKFHKMAHIDDVGLPCVKDGPFFHNKWAASAAEVEVLRIFRELHGKSGTDRLREILLLLGFEEYVPEVTPRPASALAVSPAPAVPVPSSGASVPASAPISKEVLQIANTREFLAENFDAFNKIIAALKLQVPISEPFEDIFALFRRLQEKITINRAVSPHGVLVEPSKDHVLSPAIREFELYGPEQTRTIFSSLDILPNRFHMDVSDAYLCRVKVALGEEEFVLNSCIIPPMMEVYILGVDSSDVAVNREQIPMVLKHAILDAFYRTVKREHTPDNRAAKLPEDKHKGTWGEFIRTVIRDVTQEEYPVLVTSWGGSGHPKQAGAELSGEPQERTYLSKAEFLEMLFLDMATDSRAVAEVLTEKGVFIMGRDYAGLFKKSPHAVSAGKYPNVYMPLRTAEEVLIALQNLDSEHIYIPTSGWTDWRLPYVFRAGGEEMPSATVFKESDFDATTITDADVLTIVAKNRVRMAQTSDDWIRGLRRSAEMTFAAKVQDQYVLKQSGDQASLSPRARALLVWEFEEPHGDRSYAFTYLDALRDPEIKRADTVPAVERLKDAPRIRTIIEKAMEENKTGQFSDFSDPGRWHHQELLRLEREGIITLKRDTSRKLIRDAQGNVTIIPLKKILRKKLVILEEEQVGYRQFASSPVKLTEYVKYLHRGGANIPEDITYDPQILTESEEAAIARETGEEVDDVIDEPED